MRTTIRGTRHRAVALLAAAALGAVLLGGCAEDSEHPGAAGSPGADAGRPP